MSKYWSKYYGRNDGYDDDYGYDDYGEPLPFTWLADDDSRCFRMAIDNNLDVVCNNELVVEVFSLTGDFISTAEKFTNYSDKYEATRIAILRCLDAMKG